MSGLEKYMESKRMEWAHAPKDNPELLGMSFEMWLCYELWRVENTLRFAKKAYKPSQETMDAVNKFV